ncbi:nuclear transport factor 2 family protein [Actinophytocola sp.]|uniref:nuclear transport factor 2 family protein n=1 Tax=Actinophytocola sp. TaxID=1872138 RepID=UPI003D6B5F5B
MVDRAEFAAWIERYERSWRSAGTAHLRELFTEDASYLHAPYEEPVVGLPDIERDWEAERDGPDEMFTMAASIVAVEGDTGVARVLVRYGEPVRQEYQDLWLVRFAADGRCVSFEEWPYWPNQAWTASPGGMGASGA